MTGTPSTLFFILGAGAQLLLLVWAAGRFYQGVKILGESLRAITAEVSDLHRRVSVLEKVEKLREIGAL